MIRRKSSSQLEIARRRRWQNAKGLGQTRKQIKAAKDAHEREVIAAVRDAVWARSAGRCEDCGRALGWLQGELHERISRATTRGRPAEERFNLAICQRLCRACHLGAHHR